jgi:hypothetical protein
MNEFDVETRAATILLTVLGFEPFIGLDGDHQQRLIDYVQRELEIITEHGGAPPQDLFAAPDCREMGPKETAKALPGLITWEQLKAGSEYECNWASEATVLGGLKGETTSAEV